MIPVFEPVIGDEDVADMVAALRRGKISGSFGQAIPTFENELARIVGAKHAVAVSSGTTALHVAVAAAGIGPGDEVLISASTNVATALWVTHNGAMPVPGGLGRRDLDLDRAEALVRPRTRAILPVHLFGHPVDMDRVAAIPRRHNLVVIEDCAESHGATVRGRMTGGPGDMGCFSFYANKIVTTGEGGAVTTNDDRLAERVRLLRNLAFTTPRFGHEELGHNFRMTGMQAALGVAQLRRFDSIVDANRRMAHTYHRFLGGVRGLRLPPELPWAKNVYWMYTVEVLPDAGVPRKVVVERLAARGIETRTFFCPMNQQPCLQRLPGFARRRVRLLTASGRATSTCHRPTRCPRTACVRRRTR